MHGGCGGTFVPFVFGWNKVSVVQFSEIEIRESILCCVHIAGKIEIWSRERERERERERKWKTASEPIFSGICGNPFSDTVDNHVSIERAAVR